MSNTPHELHEEFPAEAEKIHALKVSNTHFARLADEYHEINRQVHRELASFMVEKPATITRSLKLMVISKSLERIADHATNIAEQVVYLLEAVDIRHSEKKAHESKDTAR